MKYSLLQEHYTEIPSVIHRLDPRVKIISLLVYIILVSLTPPNDFLQFGIYFVIIFIVAVLTHLPMFYILRRTFIILPFILLLAIFLPFFKKDSVGGSYNLFFFNISYTGVWAFCNVVIKAWLAILSITVFTGVTKFSLLLKGLESLYVPKILIMLLSFMYRYIFVLLDEVHRIEQAWKARYFGGKYCRQLKVFGSIIGVLFIRTYGRGERVYQSMCARGFEGEVRVLHRFNFSVSDIYFCILFLGSLLMIKVWRVL